MKISRIIEIAYMLLILSLTYTACRGIPIINKTLFFILLGFAIPFITPKSFISSKYFFYFIVYILVVGLNVWGGDRYFDSVMSLVYEAAYLFIPASMFYYTYTNNRRIFEKHSLSLFFIILVLTTIATALISINNPGVIRHMNTYSREQSEGFYDSLYRLGLMTYQFPHAIPCLVPSVVFGLKRKQNIKYLKVLLWMALICIFLVAYYSGSFTCMVMTIGSFLVSWVIRPEDSTSNAFQLLVLGVIMFLIVTFIQTSLFATLLSSVSPDSDFYDKIVELQEINETGSISSVGGDVDARNSLYLQSIDSGMDNMLFGSDGARLGNHSTLLDRFGTLGLLGITPYIVFILSFIFFEARTIPQRYRSYFWVGAITTLVIITYKSTNSWDIWFILFFIFPISLRWIIENSSEKKEKRS